MLGFLGPRAIPGVEVVEAGAYRRSTFLNGEEGFFEVSMHESGLALSVRIQFGDSRALFLIIERIRRMFDLNADWQAIAARLRFDRALAGRVEASPGLRVPGCWDGFELAVRAILGQQVTVKGATTLAGRLVKEFGRPFGLAAGITHLFPQAEVLAEANLAGIGLPGARAETIRGLARAVCEARIRFEGIVESEEFLARLCEIPGIGKWTAQYVAMRALGEPDALPTGDLGLLRALGIGSARELEERSLGWRPWRAYAAMYLWNVAGASGSPGKEAHPRKTEKVAGRKSATLRQIALAGLTKQSGRRHSKPRKTVR
jgi:3-methyladenine DNA glycosylase/8-oxoguanine DNA glycosylase